MSKKKPDRDHCDHCGEHEHLHRVAITIDGKRIAKWDLCRACTAYKEVLIGTRKVKW